MPPQDTAFGPVQAICLGVAVMIVSFGPSVLLLYHRRRRQITPVHLSRGAG